MATSALSNKDFYGYIYKTTNLINNKIYIGQHKSKSFDVKYYGSGKYLKSSMNKHGKENYHVELIEWCSDKHCLDVRERFWISYYRNSNYPMYNIAKGGEGGDICSNLSDIDKQQRKVRLQKNSYFSNLTEEQSSLIHKKGWETRRTEGTDKFSDRHRQRLSDSHKGKERTQESILKGVQTRKQNGYKHTLETRQKIANSNKGKYISPETRLKISQSHKGKGIGEDNPFYGRHHTERVRKQISESTKGRFKNRIWINNGVINKRVLSDDLATYKNIGFVEGRLKWQ